MIVLGYLLVDLLRLFRVHFLYELGRYAGVDASRLDDVLLNTTDPAATIAPSPITAWSSTTEPSRSGAVAYLCPVDRDIAADRHIVADLNCRFLV
mgnify:CR=1 FL=1